MLEEKERGEKQMIYTLFRHLRNNLSLEGSLSLCSLLPGFDMPSQAGNELLQSLRAVEPK